MPASKSSKRRSRKTRSGPGAPPRAVPAQRRQERAAQAAAQARAQRQAKRTVGTVGERPPGIFGPVPVSEIAILAGIVTLIVGFSSGSGKAQDVGILLCALGVLEVSAREHFSGFRSHTMLLSLLPAVIVEVAYVAFAGIPAQRILLLVPVIPVFLVCSYFLRRRFAVARHGRVVGHR